MVEIYIAEKQHDTNGISVQKLLKHNIIHHFLFIRSCLHIPLLAF